MQLDTTGPGLDDPPQRARWLQRRTAARWLQRRTAARLLRQRRRRDHRLSHGPPRVTTTGHGANPTNPRLVEPSRPPVPLPRR